MPIRWRWSSISLIGVMLGPATYLEGICKLRADAVAELALGEGGVSWLSVVGKLLEAAEEDGTERVVRHIGDLVRSLAGLRASADVTGGFDSRLIVCLLHHFGAKFELAIASRPGSRDAEIAADIAHLLARPLHRTPPDLARLDDELPELFLTGDGQADLRRFHLPWRHALARLARGIQVMAHGGGGEHFRDHYFIQDFPFYGRRRTNFERYHDLRLAPVALPEAYFTRHSAGLVTAARAKALARLEPYRSGTNNESYNRAAYHLRTPEFHGTYFSSYINHGLDVAAPLLDHRNTHVGFRLPPWQGFFNLWHRRLITAHNPELAALPTAEGYTASRLPHHMASDLGGYAVSQLRRGAQKVSQRLSGKARFHSVGAFATNAPGHIAALRVTRCFRAAMERLKEAEILAPELEPMAVRDIHVGRILTLGMLLHHLDGLADPGERFPPRVA